MNISYLPGAGPRTLAPPHEEEVEEEHSCLLPLLAGPKTCAWADHKSVGGIRHSQDSVERVYLLWIRGISEGRKGGIRS